VYGEKDGIKIFEIEEKRRAPLQNVAKIVRWVYRSKTNSNVTLIQIFSETFYETKHGGERELAKFVGMIGSKLLGGQFEYLPMNIAMHGRARSTLVRDRARESVRSIVEKITAS
jgi:hypothetical protein